MLNRQITLKAILAGALLLASAIAQDSSAAVHPNVAISAEFPKAVAGVSPKLVSGRANNLKVTLHNSGAQDLTVKMIIGSISEVKDFTTVTHNLTPFRYDKKLKAHSALVLPYTIKLTHPSREVGLTLLAELVDPSSALHHQFPALIFNSTVHFTHPASSWFDWKLILGSMLMAGAITAIVMTSMAAKKNKSDPKKQHEKLVNDPNAAKMSSMERYAVLAQMKANDGEPLPEPKTMPTTTTATTDVLTGGEPYGILSQMKTPLGDSAERKDKNTEPEEKDRFEVLADMKATRGDDAMNPDKNMASTRAL